MYEGIYWESSCLHRALSALLSLSRGFNLSLECMSLYVLLLVAEGIFPVFCCCHLGTRESLFRMLFRVWLVLDRCDCMDSYHHMMRQFLMGSFCGWFLCTFPPGWELRMGTIWHVTRWSGWNVQMPFDSLWITRTCFFFLKKNCIQVYISFTFLS